MTNPRDTAAALSLGAENRIAAALTEANVSGRRASLAQVCHELSLPSDGSVALLHRRIIDAFHRRPPPTSPRLTDQIAAAIEAATSILGPTEGTRGRAAVRRLVWYALRRRGMSLTSIGRLDVLGTADHTTVHEGLRRAVESTSEHPLHREALDAVLAALETT